MHRSFRFRLYPTEEQAQKLAHYVGVTRLVYNLAFEQRRDHWRNYQRATGKSLNYATQGLQLTELRKEIDWIESVPYSVLVQSLRDLDKAYSAFFRGIAKYPTPRKKGINDSFRCKGEEIRFKHLNDKWSAIRITKLGWVKFRDTRGMPGELINATVSLRAGTWFLSVARDIPQAEGFATDLATGVDRGVATTLTLSDGEQFIAPVSFASVERRRRKAQRVLARRKRGSKRHARQRKRVARLHAKTGRIRNDWLHRVTTGIASRFGVVVIEDLNVKGMTASAVGKNVAQKRGLNRSILSQGWSIFEVMLKYKLEERGGRLVTVNPAYTSQTCSCCGVVDAQNRKSQAVFECVACGHCMNADHNAAINILRRNTAWLDVEGSHQRPPEASTELAALSLVKPEQSGDVEVLERRERMASACGNHFLQ